MTRMFVYVLVALVMAKSAHQHGYLSDPPSRASAWLVDKDFLECCKNYDYNQMFCGGKVRQWQTNGGKCGICGDPWDDEREYEKGGSKYLGKIVKTFNKNSPMPVKVQITANHLGYIEFRLCNVDGWENDANQECLNKTVLKIYSTNEVRYPVDENLKTAEYKLQLPENLTCQHCVLQWKYVAGNSWGHDDETNISCKGCGVAQEQFYGCADISIVEDITQTTTTKASNQNSITKVDGLLEIKSSKGQNYTNATTKSTKIKTTTTSKATSKATDNTNNNEDSTSSKECKSKLEFGSFIDLSRVVDIYCTRMCELKCKKYLNLLENISLDSTGRVNKDIRACFETCPLLCECY